MVLPPRNVDAAGFAQHGQLTLYAATTGGHLQPCASVITFGECQEDRASYFTAEIGVSGKRLPLSLRPCGRGQVAVALVSTAELNGYLFWRLVGTRRRAAWITLALWAAATVPIETGAAVAVVDESRTEWRSVACAAWVRRARVAVVRGWCLRYGLVCWHCCGTRGCRLRLRQRCGARLLSRAGVANSNAVSFTQTRGP